MQQTRLDQFYKIKYSHKSLESGSKLKSTNNDVSRKIQKGDVKKSKSNNQINVQTNNEDDCVVISEKINGSCSFNKQNSEDNETNINEISISWNKDFKQDSLAPVNLKRKSLDHSDVKKKKKMVGTKSVEQLQSYHSQTVRYPRNSATAKYLPRKPSPIKGNRSKSMEHYTSRKFFNGVVDHSLIVQAIDQLNLAKQCAIPPNKFNLGRIYSKETFNYKYNNINTRIAIKYDQNEVVTPTDSHEAILFMIIVNVFSKPVNCGYFDGEELDFVFSMLTLSVKAQKLLTRLLRRKHTWHRVNNVKYPEIDDNLLPTFQELVSKSMCRSDIETEKITTMFELLQVDELRKIAMKLKIKHVGKKEDVITTLLKFSETHKSLFPGVKSPGHILLTLVTSALGYCACVTGKLQDIFSKIMALLIPTQDPESTLLDTFFMLQNVHLQKIVFPEMPADNFPIFANREHVICYVKAKNALNEFYNLKEKKDWAGVRRLGDYAAQNVHDALKRENNSESNDLLPLHVKRFMPGYIWLKILSKSVDAFKKTPETLHKSVLILEILISQNVYMKRKKGYWYTELALILMRHKQDLTATSNVVLKALLEEDLTEVDKAELFSRLRMLAAKKNDINLDTKECIKIVLSTMQNDIMPKVETPSVTVSAVKSQTNIVGKKSAWLINNGLGNKNYGSVEEFALFHYYLQGFCNGIHCEGSLPITLFCTIFWEEIYGIRIPGACLSMYQHAPTDLYTYDFYKNRKEHFDRKLKFLSSLNSQSLGDFAEENFNKYSRCESLICIKSLGGDRLKEIILCLGVQATLGICQRLIGDFILWQAGFPDLFVWNSTTKKYKIVEVKGPDDVLSTKQKLWLQYLGTLGISTELCLVKARNDVKKRKTTKQNDV